MNGSINQISLCSHLLTKMQTCFYVTPPKDQVTKNPIPNKHLAFPMRSKKMHGYMATQIKYLFAAITSPKENVFYDTPTERPKCLNNTK